MGRLLANLFYVRTDFLKYLSLVYYLNFLLAIMKSLFAVLILLLGTKNLNGRIGFGGPTDAGTTTTSKPDVAVRGNLLAGALCKTPLGDPIPGCKQKSPESSPSPLVDPKARSGHCCC